MKRILLSLGMLVFVGGLVAGATGAFFSDTETSTGNTFAAGSIDLLVDSEAHYAGLTCTNGVWVEDVQGQSDRQDLIGDPCDGTWSETNLGPTYQFFSLSDLKPGDDGENTISLHVENNDAYMCAVVTDLEDNDPNLTEPETDAGDLDSGLGNGELAPELNFFAWADNGVGEGGVEGDNIWNGDEVALFSNGSGPASDVLDGVSYDLFTPVSSGGIGPVAGGDTAYLGLYWCYGTITIGDHTLSCDGQSVTNVSQTDEVTADISFYVEQARNNGDFTCPTPEELVEDDTADLGD